MEEQENKESKSIWGWVLVAVAVVAVVYLIVRSPNKDIEEATPSPVSTMLPSDMEMGTDPENTTYMIDGQKVTLVDGKAEEAIPNSSTAIKTYTFGQPTLGDLNSDGVDDAALILVQEPGGSGTFFYAVASIQENEGWMGTDSALLGDRIAPQTVEIVDGTMIYNYSDRPEGASMADQPSEGVSKYFKVNGLKLEEVGQIQ